MRLGLGILVGVMLLSVGCTRYAKVTAIEGDKSTPYQSLGILEVNEDAQVTPHQFGVKGAEVLSFQWKNVDSWSESVKKRLKAKLAELADERYGADAVINVEYWPDPDTATEFPDGLIYARGEMIQYKRF